MLFSKTSALIGASFTFVCSLVVPVADAQQSQPIAKSATLVAASSPIFQPSVVTDTGLAVQNRPFMRFYVEGSQPKSASQTATKSKAMTSIAAQRTNIEHTSASVTNFHASNLTAQHHTVHHAHLARAAHMVTSQSVVESNQSDLYWLSRIIEAEAGGEGMQTKIAVGDVILNRVHSPQFPNTIRNVIFQRDSGFYEFSPVENGYIFNTPSADAVSAAEKVLYQHVNIVPAALVFYNSKQTAAGSWVRQRSVISQIGNLTFSR